MQVYLDGDIPVITPYEYTSSGLAGSIPAYQPINADRAVYLIPASDHPAPAAERTNVHSDCREVDPYIVATRDETAVHATYIDELRSGNIVGYKYLDFGDDASDVMLSLLLSPKEGAADATVEVWLDAPTVEQGGTRIGTVPVPVGGYAQAAVETGCDGSVWSWISAQMDEPVSGRRAVFFVFSSDSDALLCAFDQFAFSK